MASASFEAVVNQYYKLLYKFALSLTRTEADACDLTQQTFYVWATKGDQLRDPAKIKTWLFTTLYRCFLQSHRREQRFPHQPLHETEDDFLFTDPIKVNGLDGEQALEALARVDEHYRGAVALFYLEDCSYAEIAEILQIPVGTVKSRLARGLGQLKRIRVRAASVNRIE